MSINIDDLICDDTGVYFYENEIKVFVGVPASPLKAKLLACSNGKLMSKVTGEYYSPQKCKKGYLRVTLSIRGKPYAARIHRLVASAFLPNPENLPQVNHKDGNKENNTVTNLEWISNLANMEHAVENDLTSGRKAVSIRNINTGEVTVIDGISKIELKYGLGKRRLELHLKSKYVGMYDFNGYAFKNDDDTDWPSIIGPYPGFVTLYAVNHITGILHTCDNIAQIEVLTGIKRKVLSDSIRTDLPYRDSQWSVFLRLPKM